MRDAARFFKVLADEARLQMLWLLFHHRELCVCDLMAALGITQSKASRHLGTLRHAGLVTDRKDGLWSHYALCPAADPLSRRHLQLLRATLSGREDSAALLGRLEEWLRAKSGGARCAPAGACAPARRLARPARTARTARTARPLVRGAMARRNGGPR